MTNTAATDSEVRPPAGLEPGPNQRPPHSFMRVRFVGHCDLRIWNAPPTSRLAKAFEKAVRARGSVEPEAASIDGGHVVLVRADAVLDQPVVEALWETLWKGRDVVLLGNEHSEGEVLAAVVPAGRAEAVAIWLERSENRNVPQGLQAVRSQELCSSYWSQLRKREVPYAMRATPERVRAIEWRIYLGTYKGVTDLVTKYLWPVPAYWATKFCARLRLHPNVVTLCSLGFVVLAYFLFESGYFASGLAAAWTMTLLDTIDGKLARVTMTSSRFGHVLDHGIDLIHPPFWYVAWWLGLNSTVQVGIPHFILDWALGLVLGGYLLLRIMEGWFNWRFGMHIHVWRRFDSRFRLIVSRRNPNLILLTAAMLFSRPDLGLLAVALWTTVSVLVHLVQSAQAASTVRGGQPLHSWLAESAE